MSTQPAPEIMADEKTFSNVTRKTWDCVKTTSEKENETKYSGVDQGTATTSTPIGAVVLSYVFTEPLQTLWYRIDKKPFLVSASQIWDGIQAMIDGCRAG